MNFFIYLYISRLNAQLQAPLGKPCFAPRLQNLLDESASEKMCNQVSLAHTFLPSSLPDWLAVPDGWAVEWGLATWATGIQQSSLIAFQAVPSLQNACLWGPLIWNGTAGTVNLKSCKSMKRMSSALLRNI